jgi:hypothetical protein
LVQDASSISICATEQDDEEKIKAIANKHKEKRESNVEKGVEKSAISRRKVAPSVVIEIITYKKAHPLESYPAITKHFKTTYPVVTMDMVKNYLQRKSTLFESEFPIQVGQVVWSYADYEHLFVPS